MLREAPRPSPPEGPPIEIGTTTDFDWSTRLSLETIRAHTKTDDIPGVTDEQLMLYRGAALEAAEMYTGKLLARQRVVNEPIQAPRYPQYGKLTYRNEPYYPYARQSIPTYRHELQYPVADGYVYLYGGPAHTRKTFVVPIGSRVIQVPIVSNFLDLSNCCDPCATSYLNGDMMAAYKAGYCSPAEVPAGIVLGCLQFLAWIVDHPGDELLTQRNRKDNSTKIGGVSGSNNIAMVSGALETWRQYDETAI